MTTTPKRQANSLREYIVSTKDTWAIFKWLWKETTTPDSQKDLQKMFWFLCGAMVLQAIIPGAIGFTYKGLTTHDGTMVIVSLAIFLACSIVFKYFEREQQALREWGTNRNFLTLDTRISELFFEKSAAQHTQESQRLSSATIDKAKWRMIDMQRVILFDGLQLILNVALSVIAIVAINWICGSGMLLLVSVYIFWGMYLNYKVTKETFELEIEFRALFRRRAERMEHVDRVKSCGHEVQETDEMAGILRDLLERDRKFWLWYIRNSSYRSYFNVLSLSAVMAQGAWMVWSGHWQDVGLLYPLYTWAGRVSENMWQFGQIEQQLGKNSASVQAAIAALSIPPTIVDKPDASILDHTTPHRIEFREVGHTYPISIKEASKVTPTIKGINLAIEKGEKVAIFGQSGVGKTTLFKLLLLFDIPTEGEIYIGDRKLSDIKRSSYMRGIGYAAQSAHAFDGTIRDNLTYGLTVEERAKITDEYLLRIAKLMRVDFKSLDTVVGRNGLKLSGGQAQRLLLAAAVVKNPWLMVIDEGTASLDSIIEKEVQEGLASALSGEVSALIITHRLNAVRSLCTKFVVMRPIGELQEGESQIEAVGGSFEELYQISPTFRRLADGQGVVVNVTNITAA